MLPLVLATPLLAGAAVFAARRDRPGAAQVVATVLMAAGAAVVSLFAAVAISFVSGCAEVR